MKCSHCGEREANTYYKRIVNGKKEEMHLCSECAKKLGVMDEFEFKPFSMDSFFGNLLGAGASALNSIAGIERCAYCGSSFNDIVNSGKVGCSHCYEKFEDKLTPSIEKLHGNSKHVGKYVTYTEEQDNEKIVQEDEIKRLKADLKLAIQEQRFEDAAVIRDKINALNEDKES